MPSTRATRSSVLGKRSHQPSTTEAPSSTTDIVFSAGQCLLTPDPTPNPKRIKTSNVLNEGDSNKENIPPFVGEVTNISPAFRRIRRTSTESFTPSRQTRPRNVRRYASTSNLTSSPTSPGTEQIALTPPPSPPAMLVPLHARARALLRPTCNCDMDIAGRTEERLLVKNFISSFIAPSEAPFDGNPILYISGSPGTGKTALVNAVLRTLDSELEQRQTKVLSVNCMALEGVDAVWERLAEELTSETKSTRSGKGRKAKESAVQAVQRLLTERKQRCVIVLDELDHIASSSQALSAIFELARVSRAHIRLIGIANTHTLTSSASSSASTKCHTEVTTCHFAPYTPSQLLDIIHARLASLIDEDDFNKFLPKPALALLTKKIAAQTGDVRATFEVLRGAIDLSVIAASPSSDPLGSINPCVTPALVLAALKTNLTHAANTVGVVTSSGKASDSETVTKVRELGFQARLVLLSTLLAVKRLEAGLTLGSPSSPNNAVRSPTKRSATSPSKGVVEMDTSQVYSYYSSLLSQGTAAFAPVSRSDFTDLLGVLETVGLLALSSGGSLPGSPSKSGRRAVTRVGSFNRAKGSTPTISLVVGLRMDELVRGLGISDSGSEDDNVREEEIRALWKREVTRISKATKASGEVNGEALFDQAIED